MEEEVYEASKPDPIERLAKIEGQSNFVSLALGITGCADTTEDMAALAFCRTRGGLPELLEGWVAQSRQYRRAIMQAVFLAIVQELKAKPKEWPWMRGAIADGMNQFMYGYCAPSDLRSKKFKVRAEIYRAMRSLARGILYTEAVRAESDWRRSRFGTA